MEFSKKKINDIIKKFLDITGDSEYAKKYLERKVKSMLSKDMLKKKGIKEIQAIHLELIRRASFNSFDGQQVVNDLINHKGLWKSCMMIRDMGIRIRHHIPPHVEYEGSDLIPLRDMSENYWNVDTLYILPNEGKEKELKELAKTWNADQTEILTDEEASSRLGQHPAGTKVMSVWWD